MRVYAVVSLNPASQQEIAASVLRAFHDHFMEIRDGLWLVSGEGTAKEISQRLRITSDDDPDPTTAVAIVFPIDGYYGRANPDIWEWIRINREKKTHG